MEIDGLTAASPRPSSRCRRASPRSTSAGPRPATSGRRRDERLEGVLAERRGAEEELAEAAGRHEQATAALYRLRSAIERLELRRERAEETAASAARRRRSPALPRRAGAELRAGARGGAGWAPEADGLPEAVATLERAHGERRGARRRSGGGELVRGARPRRSASRAPREPRGLCAGSPSWRSGAASCRPPIEPRASRLRSGRGSTRAAGPASSARSSGDSALRRRSSGGRRRRPQSALPPSGSSAPASSASGRRSLRRLPEDAEAEALTDEEADELRAQIARLERRREALGQVNPLAAEEHAREKARLEELTQQREDLERSLAELGSSATSWPRRSSGASRRPTSEVERHFAEVAATLFPGGNGRLVASGGRRGRRGRHRDRAAAGRQAGHAPLAPLGRREGARRDLVPLRALPRAAVPVLPPRRGRGGARRREHRPLHRAPASLLRPRAVHRRHPPEEDDGGRGYSLRRDDGRRRGLAGRRRPRRSKRRRAAPPRRPARPLRPREPQLGRVPRRRRTPRPRTRRSGEAGSAACASRSARSRQALTQELLFEPSDEASWERIEEALIAADAAFRPRSRSSAASRSGSLRARPSWSTAWSRS